MLYVKRGDSTRRQTILLKIKAVYFFRREYINQILRLCPRQSYRVIRATASGRIRSDIVLALLNSTRVGITEPIAYLPCDLLTIDEAQSAYGVTKNELRRWSRRKRQPAPHYQINRSTIRFPKELLGKWLKENSI